MSIAGTATSLDAFPTAPARTLMVRVRLLHAAFSSGPTPPAMTAPRPLSRPPQLLQISNVGAPGEPGSSSAGQPDATNLGGTPLDRTGVVYGSRVTFRLDLGGRRVIKIKK